MLKFVEISLWTLVVMILLGAVVLAATGCVPISQWDQLLTPLVATTQPGPPPEPEPPLQTLLAMGLAALGLGGIAAWVRRIRIVVHANTEKLAEHDGKLNR